MENRMQVWKCKLLFLSKNTLVLMGVAVLIYCLVENDIFKRSVSFTQISSFKQKLKRDQHEHNITIMYEKIYKFEDIQARNSRRKKHLKLHCNSSYQNLKRNEKYRHGFIRKRTLRALSTPNRAILYCRISKAGSTFMIKTLGGIFSCDKDCLLSSTKRIRELSYGKKIVEIRKSYKFLFVREPFRRLFSTYSNKFYFPKGNWSPIGTNITKRYRKNPSNDSLIYGHDVTFAEYIRFIVDEFEAGNEMDTHIRPMTSECNPCIYEFDFVGKLETMSSDLMYLDNEWRRRNISNKSLREIGVKRDWFSGLKYFKGTLEKINGSHINTYRLYQRAWRYYQITAVISKNVNMPFSKNSTINYIEFEQELENAKQLSVKNTSAVEKQKHEALLQAYSTVPLKVLERLKTFVKEDCLLFGYKLSPKWLFDKNAFKHVSKTFNYFDGIN